MQVALVDPQGSGLYNKVTRGVMYAKEEAEGKRLRNPCDTITEGVGVNRVTANFAQVRPRGSACICSTHGVETSWVPNLSSSITLLQGRGQIFEIHIWT